jgi:hypothetical protein
MTFGDALIPLLHGQRITRIAWSDNVWLVYVPGSTIVVAPDRPLGIAMPNLVGSTITYAAHIDIKTINDVIMPWQPSQCNILADDWITL